MSLELCILASGSSGNCAVVRSPGGVVLIDIGIGPRTASKRMAGTGVGIGDVRAIGLTHLDGDHLNYNWLATIVQRKIRIHCHGACVADLLGSIVDSQVRARVEELVRPFDGAAFEVAAGVEFHPIRFAHDEAGSHGFLLDGFGGRIGYATDLGRVPKSLIEHFCDVDILAMESNYDPDMQLASPRPWFLKQRIMGGGGHLSNEQAFAAIRAILDACENKRRRMPEHIVLLHRSRQCNCPRLVREFFERDRRIAVRLTLAEQGVRTGWLKGGGRQYAGEQMDLIFR